VGSVLLMSPTYETYDYGPNLVLGAYRVHPFAAFSAAFFRVYGAAFPALFAMFKRPNGFRLVAARIRHSDAAPGPSVPCPDLM
jgi:hypothetical protein